MKKILLFLVTILTVNCYSQIIFEKGYYIDNSGQKIECLIKNIDWEFNPIDFKYKVSENDDAKTIGIESVKEFGIYNISKYITKTVKIDKSSDDTDNLDTEKNPKFNEEKLFLKVLIEGKANLYSYRGEKFTKYFYNIDNSNVEQLVFKTYKNSDYEAAVNNQFRQQLFQNLKCSTIEIKDLERLEYKKNALVNIFSKYNQCNNSGFLNYEIKQKRRDLFNLSLRAHLNNSSLTIQNEFDTDKNADFGKKSSFGFGIETELILPVNKNKWTILLEPTYQSFSGPSTTKYYVEVAGPLTTEVNYNSLEIPLGVRHYFFLNNNSKLFLNSSFIYEVSLDSSIKFIKKDNSIYESLDFNIASNFAFGIGYKLYDKYSIEMRYYTTRDNLTNYNYWSSDYKKMSIIIGYSIF